MAVGGDGDDDMERDFAARLRLAPSPSASPTAAAAAGGGGGGGIAFRAPQEQFTVDDFDIGKIYGVGSYSKVIHYSRSCLCGRCLMYQ
jgi:3-phosphoinositide dependent protein kinase-1